MNRIRKLLIANRGEIAARIQRTCRDMGIATVAVFSDADADAPFVRSADEAVRVGPAPATESYLRIDAIVEAAKMTGADAIHPGYGFLAENGDFADAVTEAGLVFVGPPGEVIRKLGSKQEAKKLAEDAGVPVIPGYAGSEQNTDQLAARAEEIGFPVLLKASAGGGGKGMRIVRESQGLADAIEAAKREASSAFGDPTLLIERYVSEPRHVEIQILGDHHGNLVHLFERECSIQRRHQKIIEEAPSPALDEALRAKMGDAAIALARAAGYHNAGTVEMILAPDGAFYFLEVNTRLQVEHPVTELITGLDLVRQQLLVARGEALELSQDDVTMSGHAVEARLYAEDPARGFLPATGHLAAFTVPEGVRVDTGVETGSAVDIHYDPMLAKVISHAPTRTEALQKLAASLRTFEVAGVTTNRAFLAEVLEHDAMIAGELSTHFLEHHAIAVPDPAPALRRDAAIAATLVGHLERKQRRQLLPHLAPGFRNNRFGDEPVTYTLGETSIEVGYHPRSGGRLSFSVDGERDMPIAVVSNVGGAITFRNDSTGLQRTMRVARQGSRLHVQDRRGALTLVEQPRFPEPGAARVEGACVAPMPGKVLQILVDEGDEVSEGARLVILEAMKMEHVVSAPDDGTVVQLCVAEGEQVDGDELLVVVQPAD